MQTSVTDKVKGMLYKTKDKVREMDGKITDNPKFEAKLETKAEAKPKAKTPSDLTPQIAKRAYELYEQEGRKDGRADQDWEQAEQEILKAAKEAGPKPEVKGKA